MMNRTPLYVLLVKDGDPVTHQWTNKTDVEKFKRQGFDVFIVYKENRVL